MKFAAVFLSSLLSLAAFAGEFKGRDYKYVDDGRHYTGFLVSDGTKRPGVLYATEWWGITQHDKDYAMKIAAEGYTVLVADFYQDGQWTLDPVKASERMEKVMKDEEDLMDRVDAAYLAMKKEPLIDSSKIAIVGFGLGGGVGLDYARSGADLKAVVNYYGGLNPAGYADASPKQKAMIEKRKIKVFHPEVLVIVGEDDAYVTEKQIKHFEKEMKKEKVKYRVEILKGTAHGFVRPDSTKISEQTADQMKLFFFSNPKAERQAWPLMTNFLKERLK